MTDDDLDLILEELKRREPIFHRRQFGTSRADLEQMTDEDFWEIGASGRIYRREYVISTLIQRYQEPEPHDWPCSDFSIQRLGASLYLLSYTLEEPDRSTRRTTIWRRAGADWKIVFHQGTVIG